MCIYYFHVSCDAFDAHDSEGQHCPDVAAARAEALVAAGELIRQELWLGGLPCDGWIDVEDASHRRVLRMPLRSAAS